jgi:hypothetical protein
MRIGCVIYAGPHESASRWYNHLVTISPILLLTVDDWCGERVCIVAVHGGYTVPQKTSQVFCTF